MQPNREENQTCHVSSSAWTAAPLFAVVASGHSPTGDSRAYMSRSRETRREWDVYDMDDRRNYFFKVMMGDFQSQMIIPNKFAQRFRDKIQGNIKLKACNGSTCTVLVTTYPNKLVLEAGWEAFVSTHDIRLCDFLIFRYNGNFQFEVLIFDSSGCVKESSNVAGSICGHVPQRHRNFIDISNDSDNYHEPMQSPGNEEPTPIKMKGSNQCTKRVDRSSSIGDLNPSVTMDGLGSQVKKPCACCKRYMDHLHGKMMCFHILMSANYRHSMKIPARFMNQFGGNITESIDIESPNGSVYAVKGTLYMNKMVPHPQCGWKAFVDDHRIKENDSLVFQHIDNARFKVLILDPDGCEKVFPCDGIKIGSNIPERGTDCVGISESSRDRTNKPSRVGKRVSSCQRDSPCKRSKASRITTTSSSFEKSGPDSEGTSEYESSLGLDDPQTNRAPDYVLTRMSYLSEEQEEQVDQLIKEVQPEITVFVAIMKPSNVKPQSPSLVIPRDYAALHFPHKNQIVTLHRPGKNKNWHPRYNIRKDRNNHMLVGKWSDFVQDNHVKEGDICILKPLKSAGTKRFTVIVHLIRQSKVDTLRENGNVQVEGQVNGSKIVHSSCEGRPKAKVTPTTHVKEEPADQGPLESDDSGGPSNRGLYILSSHAHLTDEQEKKVEEIVGSIRSQVPVYVAVMTKSSVGSNSNCFLYLTKRYSKYLPDGEHTVTLLRNGKGKKSSGWEVKMVGKAGYAHAQMFTLGWRGFVHDNCLELDDICLFQLKEEKTLTMTVYVIRHAKHC